jgi:hypothetical protein
MYSLSCVTNVEIAINVFRLQSVHNILYYTLTVFIGSMVNQNIPIDSVVSNLNLDRVQMPVTTKSTPFTSKVISAIEREGRQSKYGAYYA